MHKRALLIAAGLLATILATAAMAGGSAKPDLAVKRVSLEQDALQPGQSLKVTVAVANRGGRAAKSQLRMLLSSDARPGGGDVALRGAPRVASLASGASRRLTAKLTVPATAPAGSVRLLACADGARKLRERNERNNCRASGAITVAAPAASPAPPAPPAPATSPPPLASPAPAPPPPPGAATRKVSGRVLYTKRDCTNGPATEAPLAGATIRLEAAPIEPVLVPLDAQGRFIAEVPGNAPIQATAITDGPRIAVVPDVSPARPYEIPLGELKTPGQTFRIGPGPGNTLADPASGAANIYTVLDRGARVAESASPVALPKVQARWRYMGDLSGWLGDRTPSQYDDSGTNELYVGGTLHQGQRDEWTAFPLLHEYGHHVLQYVASPPGAYGTHGFDTVHQSNPALPWSEGFSNAFAAIAQGNPKLTLGCETYVDLGTKPAMARPGFRIPRPSRPELAPMPPTGSEHLAQYNETAIAGAVWGVVAELGANDRAAGLGRLLHALHAFKGKYGAPEDMREVRDSLTEFAVNGSEDLEQRIGNAFDDHRLRWGFHVEGVSQVVHGLGSGWVVPAASGSFCDMASPPSADPIPRLGDPFFVGPTATNQHGARSHYGNAQVFGPLGHTHHDECWQMVRGAWLDANATVNYSLISTLPYRPAQAHRSGKTRIGVVFRCASGADICAGSSRTVTLRVGTGIWHRPDGQRYLDAAVPLNAKTVTVSLPAHFRPTMADVVPIVEIDALGYCRTLVSPQQDCST